MLMSVQNQSWRMAVDILRDGLEALMRPAVALVVGCWRIMGNQHVHRRQVLHNRTGFFLCKEEGARVLVTPTAIQATKAKPKGFNGSSVQALHPAWPLGAR